MRRMLSGKREGRKISPSYGGDGAAMRACATRCRSPVARRLARGPVRRWRAQCAGEEEGEEDEGKFECGGGKRSAPSPYLIAAGGDRARGILCARSP